jgi:nudix-type nucleoside diphosphatase (YffH/AdpP family)
MPKKVEILYTETGYKKAIFRIVEAKLRHERFDGTMSREMTRLSLERPDAVAAIMYNPEDDTVLIEEIFRYPIYEKTKNGWLYELPAGVVDDNETPTDAMKREIEEETGYRVDAVKEIFSFFLSPGSSSERIFFYFARINPSQKISKSAGLNNEDIRTLHLKVNDVLKMLEERKIYDAKTIIGLQWLAANRFRIKSIDGDDD